MLMLILIFFKLNLINNYVKSLSIFIKITKIKMYIIM
jgi:hypothetical protein